MKSTIIFMLLSCTSCLCSKCAQCEHIATPKVKKEHHIELRTQKHDDTNPATSYKGRQTSKSLYRPDTRGSIAEANYRQYPARKHKNDNSHQNRGC